MLHIPEKLPIGHVGFAVRPDGLFTPLFKVYFRIRYAAGVTTIHSVIVEIFGQQLEPAKNVGAKQDDVDFQLQPQMKRPERFEYLAGHHLGVAVQVLESSSHSIGQIGYVNGLGHARAHHSPQLVYYSC